MESGKRICLVTGAGGFVGSEISKRLVQIGFRVRGLLKPKESPISLNQVPLEMFESNLLDRELILKACQGVYCVFHTASLYTSTPFYDKCSREMYQTNIEGTQILLDAALSAGVKKFIYTSSAGTIGLREDGNAADEGASFNCLERRSHYEKSKAKAEALVLSYASKGLNVACICPSFLIGVGDRRPTPTGEVILKFLNKKYPCYFEGILNLSDLESTIAAHISAMDKGANGGRYLVTSKEVLSVEEFFCLLEKITGVKRPRFKIPLSLLAGFACLNELLIGIFGLRDKVRPLIAYELIKYFTLRAKYDSSKAIRELGFKANSIEAELEKAINWFMQNGDVCQNSKTIYCHHVRIKSTKLIESTI